MFIFCLLNSYILLAAMICPLSEGFKLLHPHRLKSLQIIPVVIRRIVDGLELAESTDIPELVF
jgi:hypothetical protein